MKVGLNWRTFFFWSAFFVVCKLTLIKTELAVSSDVPRLGHFVIDQYKLVDVTLMNTQRPIWTVDQLTSHFDGQCRIHLCLVQTC